MSRSAPQGEAEPASQTLKHAIADEVLAIKRRIEAQSEQVERLRHLIERIEDKIREDSADLADLQGALGEAAELRIDDLDQRLGGQRLERVAIRLLEEQPQLGSEIHYKEWFDLITEAGYKVTGRNPLGTFLAQLSRSPAIEPIGHRTGRYRLRLLADPPA
jgi:hypothetical protein